MAKIKSNSLKIFLPYTIKRQYDHYKKLEGKKKAQTLFKTLSEINLKYPKAIIENTKKFKSYRVAADNRNNLIVRNCDYAILFSPSKSRGTLNAIKKLKEENVPHLIAENFAS